MINNFEKYKELFEERAGIIENDGVPKIEAEKKAWLQIKYQYIEENKLDLKKQESYNELVRLERQLLTNNL